MTEFTRIYSAVKYILFSKLDKTCLKFFKLVQIWKIWFRLVQTCINLPEIVQTCLRSSKLVWNRSNWSKPGHFFFNFSGQNFSEGIPVGKTSWSFLLIWWLYFSDCTIGTYGVLHKLPVISNFQQNPTVTVLMIMPEDLSVSILLESQIPCFENSTYSKAEIRQNPTRIIKDFRYVTYLTS